MLKLSLDVVWKHQQPLCYHDIVLCALYRPIRRVAIEHDGLPISYQAEELTMCKRTLTPPIVPQIDFPKRCIK